MRAKHNLKFDILYDAGNAVASRFGLTYRMPDDLIELYKSAGLDIPAFNGDDSWTLPIPARFVISMDGVVRKADADPDYTRRPEPDETVAFLRTLRV